MTTMDDAKALAETLIADKDTRDVTLKFAMLLSILVGSNVISFDAFKHLIEQPDWTPRDYVESMRAAGGTPEQMEPWEKWLEQQEMLSELADNPLFNAMLKGFL